jgi:hypothetical protein
MLLGNDATPGPLWPPLLVCAAIYENQLALYLDVYSILRLTTLQQLITLSYITNTHNT